MERQSELADELWSNSRLRFTSELAYPEARAALAAAHRGERLNSAEHRMAVKNLEVVCESMKLIGADFDLCRRAGDVAEAYALGGYDAVHLATALSISADQLVVATWDRCLAQAARSAGCFVAP